MGNPTARHLGALGAVFLLAADSAAAFTPRAELEIHILNVQQANTALVIGPGVDGRRVLLDAGHRYKEDNGTLRAYLSSIGLLPADGFHYTFASHLHEDHIEDFETLFVDEPSYVVHAQSAPSTCINCYNGSAYTSTMATSYRNSWLSATGGGNPTPVQVLQPPALPQTFPLGDGARIEVLAANGQIAGNTPVSIPASNENARSMVLLVTYGDFHFIWGGDATGESEACYDAGSVKNIEGKIIEAVAPSGIGARRLTAEGVDVMQANHHGSATSTCADWMNTMRPEVAVVAVGRNTDGNPEVEVVEDILLAGRFGGDCVTVDPALVLQGDEGELSDGASDDGFVVGDLVIRSNGATFSIEAKGRITYGPDERGMAGLPAATPVSFLVDDAAPDCPMMKFVADATLVYLPDQAFRAKHHVGNEGGLIVQAGGEALMEAGTQVVFANGLAVEEGGTLLAAVRPLTDCAAGAPQSG